jgi:hypothetical protein
MLISSLSDPITVFIRVASVLSIVRQWFRGRCDDRQSIGRMRLLCELDHLHLTMNRRTSLVFLWLISLYRGAICWHHMQRNAVNRRVTLLRQMKKDAESNMSPGYISSTPKPMKEDISKKSLGLAAVLFSVAFGSVSSANAVTSSEPLYERPKVYSIEMTDPPCMIPRTKEGEVSLIDRLSRCRVLLLGHHDGDANALDYAVEVTNDIMDY